MAAQLKSKLTLLFLFVYSVSFAQPSQVRDSVILRFGIPDLQGQFPFGKIEVTDSRPDVSKIGYIKKKNKDARVVAAAGLATHFEQLLNASTKEKTANASEQSVLIVIKKFWLKVPTEADWRRKRGVDGRELKSFWAWHVKLEVYGSQAGAYTPLFRLDSLYGFDDFDEHVSFTADALSQCLQRLQNFDPARLKTAKTKYTRQALDSFNQTSFLKPVLTQPALQAGVFLTFSDFINKHVVYPEFAIERSIEVDNLYVLKNGTKELLMDFWGFCDGKNYYIRGDHNFYKLYQQGNTFEFLGHEYLTIGRGAPFGLPAGNYNSGRQLGAAAAGGLLTDAILGGGKTREGFRPFQLNIETGEVY